MASGIAPHIVLHDGERGGFDAADEQPAVQTLEGAWDAASILAAFDARRAAWFDPDLRPHADNIAAMLSHEHDLSVQWNGLPGTDHPARWHAGDPSVAIDTAQVLPRTSNRLATWHPPLAWMMPIVRRRGRTWHWSLPLASSAVALEQMALNALPPRWQRGPVAVRIEIDTRVYWGARSVHHDGVQRWEACLRRGEGFGERIGLFTLVDGRVAEGAAGRGSRADRDGAAVAAAQAADANAVDDDTAVLKRHLRGGIGLLVAVPVMSFERPRRWHHVVAEWWRAALRRTGWVRRADRDPTFAERISADEPTWNLATGASSLAASEWRQAMRHGALLRPANAAASRWLLEGGAPGVDGAVPAGPVEVARAGSSAGTAAPAAAAGADVSRHVVLIHGGLSSVRSTFEALMPAPGTTAQPSWPGMPPLDAACTWRFEHDTFAPVSLNIRQLADRLARDVVRDALQGTLVLFGHSRGGSVVRFALPALRARFPGWRFSGITAGGPHLGTSVFSRIGRRWTGLALVVDAARHLAEPWLKKEQLRQLVILERGLAYDVPPGFHDVEPAGVERMTDGHPGVLPDGLWTWGSDWGPDADAHPAEHKVFDWVVEDIGGAVVDGDGLVPRQSALGGRAPTAEGCHDASPVFHTRYFAHAQTRGQIEARLCALLGQPLAPASRTPA